MAVQRQIDRFKLSLAIVDVLGIIAFFWTSQWVILVYLTLFNFVIILIDVIRKGMIVRPVADAQQMPDELPIDPETGNLYTEMPVAKPVQQRQTPPPVRNVPSPEAVARKVEPPFADIEQPKAETKITHDPQRKEIEDALEEWVSK